MAEQKIKALLFMKAKSERVPGKNLRKFCGRPLFHWILDSLNKSQVIEEIIINTDSEEIADNAQENFDVTIHMRPEYLLKIQDNEANQIMSYDLGKTEGEYFIQTHSTNPLIKAETFRSAIEKFFNNLNEFDSLFSVTELQTRLYNNERNPLNHDPKKLIKTQSLPLAYVENSCFYIFTRKSFTTNKNRLGTKPYFYSIDRNEAVDIDEEFDFSIAKMLMQSRLDRLL